ncbi:hypothetical protein ES708_19534 [subsurface metagenome]
MLYTWDVEVDKDDDIITSKKEVPMRLAPGIITWVSVLFPPGCHGMVKCQIFHHEHQIFPSRDVMSLSGDGVPIEWSEYYEMYEAPYDLKARLWGENCTYDHTVSIRIAVLPRKAIVAQAVVDAIKGAFGMLSPKRIFTRKQGEK